MRSSKTLDRKSSEREAPAAGALGVKLGPATVREVGAVRVGVTRASDGQELEAELALAFLYQPVVGDVLLVISQEGAHYAIGVLYAQGTAGIAVQGDLALHAVGGKLKLVGDEGVVLHTAGEATLSAKSIKTVAGKLVERLGSVTRWVSGHVSLKAAEVTRMIDGTETTHSKRSYHLAEEQIKIDSHEVHLGH